MLCTARTGPRYQLGHASTRCAVTGCISILPCLECFDVLGFAWEASFCLDLLGMLVFCACICSGCFFLLGFA